MQLTWVSANEQDKLVMDSSLVCKYVRREIRALTEDDRTRFLDTLRTLYDLRSDEGQSLYGSRYNDMHYFVKKVGGADVLSHRKR